MAPLDSVLIVDDEPAVRDIMTRWAASLGLRPTSAASADEALATLRTRQYDVAVIDVMMPGHDGMWLASEMKKDHPQTAVVISTAYSELLSGDKSPVGIADLLIKPFPRERFLLAIERGRQWHKAAVEDRRWHARLALELRDRLDTCCARIQECAAANACELEVVLDLLHTRAPDVAAHGERVARFALAVARQLNAETTVGDLELAALLHDIGKVTIPEPLLSKPSPLTPGEAEIMRRHVDAGAEILGVTRTLNQLAPIVLATHEWFDGRGYPSRLSGADIPLSSRIIAVCDAYDAITQTRKYRGGLDSAEAVAEILRCSGAQFDPDVVSAFIAVLGTH